MQDRQDRTSRGAQPPPARQDAAHLPGVPRVAQLQALGATLQRKPNRTGLPDGLKLGLERMGGQPLDHVRVHYNSTLPAQLNAHAYTQGSDIHVAPGGERHVAHESWHVVQQMQGRVRPTTAVNGVAVNDDARLEHEADAMGERAAREDQATD